MIFVPIRARIMFLPSSPFSACGQSMRCSLMSVFRDLSGLKKITNLHMSCRVFEEFSKDIEKTPIGCKVRLESKFYSDSYSA
jgi:hypothetical protein